MADLVVRGCRGSMAVSGEEFRRYGGNTSCFTSEVEPGHHLVIDCGTGLRGLQNHVSGRPPARYSVFLTHYHWDHIQGLPVFLPLFEAGSTFEFHGPPVGADGIEKALNEVMRPPWWPISLEEAAARTTFHELDGPTRVGGVRISHVTLNHPQGVAAYRCDGPSRSVVVATDHEAGDAYVDGMLAELARDTDVLIHDAQYTPNEHSSMRKGWGHSTWETAVAAAREAGAKRLVLTSHDPDRSDDEIDTIRSMARALFPPTDAAYEGMTIPL